MKTILNLISGEKALAAAMVVGYVVAVAVSGFADFSRRAEEVPGGLFRLHIIARSDSERDQRIKLMLRDFLLDGTKGVFSESASQSEAKAAASANLAGIERVSSEYLRSLGYNVPVKASVENTYFPTRHYGSVVTPAGNYDALRIVIGEGEGENWWCVLFPPLCLPAVSDKALAGNTGKKNIRFALFEALEKAFKRNALDHSATMS